MPCLSKACPMGGPRVILHYNPHKEEEGQREERNPQFLLLRAAEGLRGPSAHLPLLSEIAGLNQGSLALDLSEQGFHPWLLWSWPHLSLPCI